MLYLLKLMLSNTLFSYLNSNCNATTLFFDITKKETQLIFPDGLPCHYPQSLGIICFKTLSNILDLGSAGIQQSQNGHRASMRVEPRSEKPNLVPYHPPNFPLFPPSLCGTQTLTAMGCAKLISKSTSGWKTHAKNFDLFHKK